MTADMVRQMPDLFALVVRGGLSPVVARLPLAWKDKAYRRARRGGWAVYRTPVRWAEPLPLPETGPDWAPAAPETGPPAPASDHSDDFAWSARRP